MRARQFSMIFALLMLLIGKTAVGAEEKEYGRFPEGSKVGGYYYVDYNSPNPEAEGFLEFQMDNNKASITGLFGPASVHGEYNPETGILRLPEDQAVFFIGKGGTNYLLNFNRLGLENGVTVVETSLPYGEFQYIPAGEKDPEGRTYSKGGWYMDPMTLILFSERSNKGDDSKSVCMRISYIELAESHYQIPSFEYTADEWTDCGKAIFTDGWFASCIGDENFGAYKVECRKRGTEILLLNPYGKDSPYSRTDPQTGRPYNISAETADGYILLDIGDPECVLVRPFINSGFNYNGVFSYTTIEGDSLFYPCSGFFSCTTREAEEHYIEHHSIEDIKREAEVYRSPIGHMNSTGLIQLPHTKVQSPWGTPWHYIEEWTRDKIWIDKKTRETSIQLPEAAYSSVEEVSVAPDEPARYFSLQGIELTAPTPGTPVIVREGNRTRKVIY